MDPANESFWGSKTMQLIFLAFGLITLLVILAVAAKVLFGVDVFNVIAAAITSVTALAGGGTYRNAKVDGPIRQQYAALDVAEQAKAAGVSAPMPSSMTPLQTWTPGEDHPQ